MILLYQEIAYIVEYKSVLRPPKMILCGIFNLV